MSSSLAASRAAANAGARKTLRAGVIGYGVGAAHAAAIVAHSGAQLGAIADICPEKRQQAQRDHPRVAIVPDTDALLIDPELDLIVIASYDDAHHAQVMAALRAGKHVFVEKPLCQHAWQTREIRNALRRRPAQRLSCNLILRASPRFVDLRARVRSGALGDVFHLRGSYDYGRAHKITAGWRGRTPDYSVTLGGAIHVIDLMLWITGARVARVAASGNQIATRGTPFKLADHTAALLTFENGVTALVSANFASHCPHFHELAVYGARGTFINGWPHATLYESNDPDCPPRVIESGYPAVDKGALLTRFVDEIVNASQPLVRAEEVFDVMAVCHAIDAACRQGAVVAPDYGV